MSRFALALSLGLFAWVGCRTTAGTGGTGPYGNRADFSGRVTDQQRQPVARARVEINGRETLSKGDGTFQLSVPAGRLYVLNFSHPDFADFSYISRTPLAGQTWRLVRAQIETVDAKNSITLEDRRSELTQNGIGGASFTLPANSLVDDRGNAPGPVRAAIATLDVGNGEAPGDWAVRSDDGQRDGFLVSYGAVFIQFTDATGSVRYRLRQGRTGQLKLPVIPSMRTHAPGTPQARFWYYDYKDGYWKHTGAAVFDGSKAYTGSVRHLSTINTDIAKFDAACLKVTLDPSIALGLKLRIRYHSGGTPFGQTPTFVMNDTVNAAYRLPANTNVLLELLDVNDEAFGNLVVEDPVGTPLVNTVVNTGPPLPQGESLWPPAPFTPCKPILLKMGLPQVELRINASPADPGMRDNPSDDYLTWAPTFSIARLTTPMMADVNVVLTNDPPGAIPGGGDVLFAANVDPWPANTTATSNSVALVLPANGSWVPFVVAGKLGTPSTNDKDTIVEAHLDTNAGAVLGTKALMVRVRKNANNLTASERARFLFAWQKFRNKLGDNYIQFQEMHRLATMAGDEAHMQPGFLSWHRTFLLHLERELQKLEPSVALHYWNWDAAAPNVFHEDFIGAHGVGGFVAEPVFAPSNPLNGWNTDLPFSGGELRRNTSDHTLDPGGAMKPLDDPVDPSLVAWSDFGPTTSGFSVNSFSDDVEKTSHNPSHGWPCAGGNVTNPNRSATDPLFYLLHSQIDREWAYWQQKHNRFGVVVGSTLTFPAPAHYDNNGNWNTPPNVADANFRQKGSFLLDGLWPWDGTTDGTTNTPEWRPPNQAGGPGDMSLPENIPASTPLIPTTAFPASVRRNLWPAVPTIPRNADMIDYLGKAVPQNGLGFCYDDVPY
jgi:tyrosinase